MSGILVIAWIFAVSCLIPLLSLARRRTLHTRRPRGARALAVAATLLGFTAAVIFASMVLWHHPSRFPPLASVGMALGGLAIGVNGVLLSRRVAPFPGNGSRRTS